MAKVGKPGDRIDKDIRDAVVQLVDSELSATQIIEKLKEVPILKGRKFPHPRTVQKILKAVREHVDILDKPFEWHRLPEYGLPWESAELVLKVWRRDVESYRFAPPGMALPLPTARKAVWWWRVYLADRDAPLGWIMVRGSNFAYREWAHIVFGDSTDMACDEAALAYGYWRGEERLAEYREAVKEGIIPPLVMTLHVHKDNLLVEEQEPLLDQGGSEIPSQMSGN